MGSSSSSIPKFNLIVQIKQGDTFQIPYVDLIDHILLLRQVISHPEMTQEGPMLDYFIKDYCKRMANLEMITELQQLKLPWQIEWIWHVHRLHPLVYDKDCKQLTNEKLVDKMVYSMIKNRKKKRDSKIVFKSIKSRLSFIPSIDLAQAVIRQRDFLEKFKQHRLYSWNFKQVNRSYFEDLAENYVLFMRLARKNEMIVPTFDIDLIWHSHMRYPSHYQKCSIALCGFILDHDDSIEHNTLSDNYQKTADRWKTTYNTDYDKKKDRKNSSSGLVGGGCGSICGGGDGGAGCGGGGDGGGGDGGGCGGGGCGGGD